MQSSSPTSFSDCRSSLEEKIQNGHNLILRRVKMITTESTPVQHRNPYFLRIYGGLSKQTPLTVKKNELLHLITSVKLLKTNSSKNVSH